MFLLSSVRQNAPRNGSSNRMLTESVYVRSQCTSCGDKTHDITTDEASSSEKENNNNILWLLIGVHISVLVYFAHKNRHFYAIILKANLRRHSNTYENNKSMITKIAKNSANKMKIINTNQPGPIVIQSKRVMWTFFFINFDARRRCEATWI